MKIANKGFFNLSPGSSQADHRAGEILARGEHPIFHTLPVLNPPSPAERSCKVTRFFPIFLWQLSSPVPPRDARVASDLSTGSVCPPSRTSIFVPSLLLIYLARLVRLCVASVTQSESGRLGSNIAVLCDSCTFCALLPGIYFLLYEMIRVLESRD